MPNLRSGLSLFTLTTGNLIIGCRLVGFLATGIKPTALKLSGTGLFGDLLTETGLDKFGLCGVELGGTGLFVRLLI